MSVTLTITFGDGSQIVFAVENFSWKEEGQNLKIFGHGRQIKINPRGTDTPHDVAGKGYLVTWEQRDKRYSFTGFSIPPREWYGYTFHDVSSFKEEALTSRVSELRSEPTMDFVLQAPQARLIRLSSFGCWQSAASNVKLEIAGPKVTLSGNGSFLRLPNDASQAQTDVWKTKDPQADTLLTLEVEEQKHALLLKDVQFSGPGAGFLYQAELVEYQESARPPSAPSPVPTSLVKSEPEKIIFYRLYDTGWGNRAEVPDLHCTIAPGRKHFLLQCQYSSLEAPPREQLASYMPVSWPGEGQMLFWIQDGKEHRLFTTREARFAFTAGDRLEFEGDILQYDILDLTTKSEPGKTILCQGSCPQTVMQRRYEGGTVHEADVKDVVWKIWQEGGKTFFEIQSAGGWSFSQGLHAKHLDYTPEEKAQFAPGKFQHCFRWLEGDIEHKIFCDIYDDHQPEAYSRRIFFGEVASHFHEPIKKPEPEKISSTEEPTVTLARDTLPILSWDVQPLTCSSFLDESWVTTPSNPIEVELASGALSPNQVRELLGRGKYSPAEAVPEPVTLTAHKLVTQINVPEELLDVPSKSEQDPLPETSSEITTDDPLFNALLHGAAWPVLSWCFSTIGVGMFEYFEKLSGKDVQTLIRGAILGIASSLISLAVIKLMKWVVTKKPPVPESAELLKLKELFTTDPTVFDGEHKKLSVWTENKQYCHLYGNGDVYISTTKLELPRQERSQRIALYYTGKEAALKREQKKAAKHQQDLLNNLRTLKV